MSFNNASECIFWKVDLGLEQQIRFCFFIHLKSQEIRFVCKALAIERHLLLFLRFGDSFKNLEQIDARRRLDNLRNTGACLDCPLSMEKAVAANVSFSGMVLIWVVWRLWLRTMTLCLADGSLTMRLRECCRCTFNVVKLWLKFFEE
jgi:hypothetical protein